MKHRYPVPELGGRYLAQRDKALRQLLAVLIGWRWLGVRRTSRAARLWLGARLYEAWLDEMDRGHVAVGDWRGRWRALTRAESNLKKT